jgi:hypothetical protein
LYALLASLMVLICLMMHAACAAPLCYRSAIAIGMAMGMVIGCVIGLVHVACCVERDHPFVAGNRWAWGPQCWYFDRVFPLRTPVPATGQQRLWNPTQTVLNQVLQQIPIPIPLPMQPTPLSLPPASNPIANPAPAHATTSSAAVATASSSTPPSPLH